MRQILKILILLISYNYCFAQNINFDYDATGNRIQRIGNSGIGLASIANTTGTIELTEINTNDKKLKNSEIHERKIIKFKIDTSYQRMVELRSHPFYNQVERYRDSVNVFPIEIIAQPVTGFFQFSIDDKLIGLGNTSLKLLSKKGKVVFSKDPLNRITMINFQEVEMGEYDLIFSFGIEEKKWKIIVIRN